MTLSISEGGKATLWFALVTTLQQIVAMTAALAAVGTIGFWLVEPRLQEWVRSVAVDAELRTEVEANSAKIAQINQGLTSMADTLNRIQLGNKGIDTAPLEFMEQGNKISHSHAGGEVLFTWFFRKLHDCGAPKVNAFFEDSDGVLHRFHELSVVDTRGEGANMPAEPNSVQTITYSGFMPENNKVAEGAAHGWVNLRYDLCPLAPEVRSPPVRFRVLRAPTQ